MNRREKWILALAGLLLALFAALRYAEALKSTSL